MVVIVLLLGVALVMLAWGAFSVFPPVSRLIVKSFWCPFRMRRVTAQFKEAEWGGPCFEVCSCTVFAPPTAITCEKLCLRLEKLPEQQTA